MQQPSNPSSQGFHRIDIERGTNFMNNISDTWKLQTAQISMTMDLFFFSAACCVLAASFISTIEVFLTEFAPFALVDCIYLLIFGSIMFVLDAPIKLKSISEIQVLIAKYFKFLTRFFGRGIWYIFLGAMTFSTLWDNSIWYFGAFVLGFYVFFVGLFATLMGYTKSKKLNRVREQIRRQNANTEQIYNSFANTAPQQGMSSEEFNLLSGQVAGVSFKPDELFFVLNALCSGNRKRISLQDFNDWITGHMIFL